jgi:tRNA G18 (ribose-2'-O)-methylase SpoU
MTTETGTIEADSRNVVDFYKTWETEAIVADLETRRTALVNVCVNVVGDFNKAAIIRANNAFTGARVIITERRRFNKRGTVGTHHYEHVEHNPDTISAIEALIADGYTVFPVDNTPEFDPQVITSVTFPPKTAFLYGEEGLGLDAEVIAACNARPVYIAQHGSVRSLNVGQAAAIAMFAYECQHPRDELFAEAE